MIRVEGVLQAEQRQFQTTHIVMLVEGYHDQIRIVQEFLKLFVRRSELVVVWVGLVVEAHGPRNGPCIVSQNNRWMSIYGIHMHVESRPETSV